MTDMSVDDFKAKLNEATEEFVESWRKNAKAMPEVYPERMPEGEWWEQFVSVNF